MSSQAVCSDQESTAQPDRCETMYRNSRMLASPAEGFHGGSFRNDGHTHCEGAAEQGQSPVPASEDREVGLPEKGT